MRIFLAVRLASVAAVLGACATDPTTRPTAPAEECLAAIDLGDGVFPTPLGGRAQDFQLVRAENVLAGTPTCPGPRCWLLTYKARDCIPKSSGGLIGAGDETFVEVNLAARTARVTGYGE